MCARASKPAPANAASPSSTPSKKSVAKVKESIAIPKVAVKAVSKKAVAAPVFGENLHPSLSQMNLKKRSVNLKFESLADLHLQTLALADHIEHVQAPVPVAGNTYLGRKNAEAIVTDCADSDDLTITVAQCGKTGRGMQQCVEGKLTADGFDPAPLNLNILDADFLNTVVTEIAKAKK